MVPVQCVGPESHWVGGSLPNGAAPDGALRSFPHLVIRAPLPSSRALPFPAKALNMALAPPSPPQRKDLVLKRVFFINQSDQYGESPRPQEGFNMRGVYPPAVSVWVHLPNLREGWL